MLTALDEKFVRFHIFDAVCLECMDVLASRVAAHRLGCVLVQGELVGLRTRRLTGDRLSKDRTSRDRTSSGWTRKTLDRRLSYTSLPQRSICKTLSQESMWDTTLE